MVIFMILLTQSVKMYGMATVGRTPCKLWARRCGANTGQLRLGLQREVQDGQELQSVRYGQRKREAGRLGWRLSPQSRAPWLAAFLRDEPSLPPPA